MHIVEQAGQYKIYDQQGTLIATRPVSVVGNEVQEMDQTLVNGDQMRQHLTGNMSNQLSGAMSQSGSEWDVYADGISRTLKNGTIVGMMQSGESFVKVDNTVIYRTAGSTQYFISNGSSPQKLDPDKAPKDLNAQELEALNILKGLNTSDKLQLGDGTFLTLSNGKVVGGEDEAVSEPTQAKSPANQSKPTVKEVPISMVATGQGQTTSVLQDGIQSNYDWRSHQSTYSDSGGRQSAQITDNQLTTEDVITTKQGTRDRATGDFMGADGSIVTSNGIRVTANNDITFADGTMFNHDGSIVLANGTVIRANSSSEVSQQAASTLASAQSIAEAVAGKIGSGTVTFADIAQLQSSISQVSSLVGACMQAGNLEAAQSLMKSESSLEAALGTAEHSFTSNTVTRAIGPRTVPSAPVSRQHIFFQPVSTVLN